MKKFKTIKLKIIFLDIDGVIAIPSYCENNHWAINKDKIALLNKIISDTEAMVVITSSWRKLHTLKDLQKMFKASGFKGTIIGVTGSALTREEEIYNWLKSTIYIVEKYVILDDALEEGENNKKFELKNIVKTDGILGITDTDVSKAIQYLL